VNSRVSVSLIMRTGGAWWPFRKDRHFNDASSFQIAVSRDLRSEGGSDQIDPDGGARYYGPTSANCQSGPPTNGCRQIRCAEEADAIRCLIEIGLKAKDK
jgi:hypothetical protein